MRNRQISVLAKVLLLVVIIYFPYFLHLGDLPIRAWDEARLVANASEMMENGDYLVTHFHGQPEMWNTKPPLMIWSQVLFVKLMGDKEISYRMPSALAGFLTCLLIVFVSVRYLKNFWFGFIAVLAMVTSEGHLGEHVARTGDYDAMLTLFMVAYLLFFFLWTETGKKKYLHLFFAAVVFAVYTKSIQGLFFLPAVLIYLFMAGKGKAFFVNKWVYIDALLSVLLIGFYYVTRESLNPGYLKAVYENELGGRFINSIEQHTGSFTFYLDLLTVSQFKYYFALALIGIFSSFALREKIISRFIGFVSLSAVLYLLIISAAKTKLAWYSAPSVPLLSILAAGSVFVFIELIETKASSGTAKKILVQFLLIVTIFGYPYYLTIDQVYKPKEKPEAFHFNLITHVLQDGLHGKLDLDGTKLYYTEYDVHLQYYLRQMQKKGISIYRADPARIRPGDKIITSIGDDRKEVQSKYNTTEVLSYYHVSILKIASVK